MITPGLLYQEKSKKRKEKRRIRERERERGGGVVVSWGGNVRLFGHDVRPIVICLCFFFSLFWSGLNKQ